jgi:uroporphyrinogen-III decarboxylase
MLTKRQNLIETMRGGNPDRFVNQYEAFELITVTPISAKSPRATYKGPPITDAWGVTRVWPEGTPGHFPIHDAEHLVVKDITKWQDYVKAPRTDYPASEWESVQQKVEEADRNEKFILAFVAPGVFEQCHYLTEIQNCLTNFYLAPDEMHELIDYITEFELRQAEQICKYMKPDGVFHHDDWGSQISTFISPDMFEEFLLPAYKRIYGYYKSHGAELIVHHSDSYGATLVPYMIEMGINIWQGVMTTNKIPELIAKYGPQITFMGGIDSASVDRPDWTPEMVEKEVRRACTECGKHYFIPSGSQGLPMSTYPGVYEAISTKIDKLSKEMF